MTDPASKLQTLEPMRAAVVLTVLLGVLTMVTGVYFAVLRPPVLPEDIRLTGVSPDLLPPAFLQWLSIVFRTWGGFTIGFGILLVSTGMFLSKGNRRWLRAGLGASALISFGPFLASNVQIQSASVGYIAVLFFVSVGVAATQLKRSDP